MKKQRKRLLSNRVIVILKIVASGLLLFSGLLFFFSDPMLFLNDLKKWNLFPIVFILGLIWVCVYITNLVAHLESKKLYLADRLDWLYRLVFCFTVVSLIIRSIFAEPYLTVPVPIVAICIISGIMTLAIPKIVDNDNDEF
jgi:ABC-type antimicrobial peptide transport system permease subunit